MSSVFNLFRILLMKVLVLGVKGLVLGIPWLERRATASATGTEIPEVVTTQSITQSECSNREIVS